MRNGTFTIQKRFVIQNAVSKKYWSNQIQWTDDILNADFFLNEYEAEYWINNNYSAIDGACFTIVSIWL